MTMRSSLVPNSTSPHCSRCTQESAGTPGASARSGAPRSERTVPWAPVESRATVPESTTVAQNCDSNFVWRAQDQEVARPLDLDDPVLPCLGAGRA